MKKQVVEQKGSCASLAIDEVLEARRGAYRCIGSQEREVTHFVWPLRASPIAVPVLESHSLT